jgi:hypothetical protein
VANWLDALARFSANSASLHGSESGGGLFPRWVLRPFRTRNQLNQLSGEKEEEPMNPLTQFKKIPILKLLIALAVVCFGLLMSNSLAQELPTPGGIPPGLRPKRPHGRLPHPQPLPPLKDFDVWAPSFDPNGFPLNPKWGKQVRDHTIPSPKDSCPLDDSDTLHWTSSPQWPSCTSYPVSFNEGFWCKRHVNFMPVTYEGRVKWGGTGGANWFPAGDSDYELNVERDDQALYSTAGYHAHIEFDSRETVDQWDNTDTWWMRFQFAVDMGGDSQGRQLINDKHVIVIGLLGMDVYQGLGHSTSGHGKTELHPVYAMFVRLGDDQRSKQSSWAFFVRNWGNEGFCGEAQMPLGRFDEPTAVIKVLIPNAAQIVSQNIRGGARNADSTELSSMNGSAQRKGTGIELTFNLLEPDKQSWIVGDVTFQEPLSVPIEEPEYEIPPQFQALRAQIDKLPETSRKELRAQLESVIPRTEARRLEVKMIAEPTELRETQPESPGTVVRKSDLVRPAKDSVGELTRRKQLEVLRKFFAERGVQVDLPPEN